MKYAHTIKLKSPFTNEGSHAIFLAWVTSLRLILLVLLSIALIRPCYSQVDNQHSEPRSLQDSKLNFKTPGFNQLNNSTLVCPVLITTDPPTVCAPGTIDITAATIISGSDTSGATLTYWKDAAGTIPLANPTTVAISGTYYIKATSPDPCSDIKPVVVTINPKPTVTVNSPDYCATNAIPVNISATPNAAGDYTYTWTVPAGAPDPGNTQSFTSSIAGLYSVTITDNITGCTSATASGTITGYILPVINIQPSNNLICSNNTAAFFNADAPGVSNIQWQISTNNGGAWTDIAGATNKSYSFNPQPSETGQLYRAIFKNVCGSDTSVIASLDVGQGVNFPKDLDGQVSCDGGLPLSTKITGGVGLSGTLTFFWERSQDNNTWTLIPGTSSTHAASGNYTPAYTPAPAEVAYYFRLGVSNNGCVTYTNSAKIIINPVPVVSQPVNSEVCHNSLVGVNFSGTNASYFTWTNSNTAIGLSATGTGNLSFTATNNSTVPISATITVTPHNTDNGLDCPGEPKSFVIIVNPLPVVTVSPTNVACFGGTNGTATANVTVGVAPFNFSWNTNPVQNSPAATGLAAGAYIVTVTDAKNCVKTANIVITQPPVITASPIANVINALCYGGASGAVNLAVNANGGTGALTSTYNWSNGATTQNLAGVIAGTYSVSITVTDANNCSKIFTATANVGQPALLVPGASAPAIICDGGTTVISATASGGTSFSGGKYDFSINGTTFTTSSSPFTFNNLPEGSYTITVRDGNGCMSTAPIVIAPAPAAIIASATAPTVCTGLTSTITVIASGGTGVLQYSINGSTFQLSNIFSNVSAGSYTITIKDINGCTGSAPVSVLTYPLPPLPTAALVSRCGPGPVTLVAANCTGDITWYAVATGGSPIGTGHSFNPPDILATTTYYFSCTDGNGCVSPRASVIATIIPIPVVIANSNSPVCEGDDIVLSATNFSGIKSYTWTGPNGFVITTSNTSVTIPNATTDMAGTYTVVATVNGCPGLPSSVVVVVNSKTPPVALLSERCGPGPITLNASGCTGGILNWYQNPNGGSSQGTGNTFVTSSIAAPGSITYYVSCTIGSCVSPRTPVTGNAKIIPVCLITGPNNICPGTSSTYTAPAGMDTYEWTISGNGAIQGSANGRTVSILGGPGCGVYSITLTISLNGCFNTCNQSFSITDIVKPVIVSTGTGLTLGCNPDAATINTALGTANATDNCNVGIPTFTDGTVTNIGCVYTQTRTWNVVDICGNAAIPVSRTVTWIVDLTPPVIAVTASTALLCNPTAAQIAAAFGTASVTDNCSTGLTAIFSDGPEIAGAGCTFTVTRTWTVTDACNNIGTQTQT
ncbi:MAG: hypothetical protein V4717_22200, partial [Bacteroidota bacterium]